MSTAPLTRDRAAAIPVSDANERTSVSWNFLLSALIVSTLLIPPGLYRLPISGLPMDAEIYRLFMFLILFLWGISVLTDDRTRLRAIGIDGSVAFLLAAIALSFAVNMFEPRVPEELSEVIKAMFYLGAPLMLLYAIRSVIKTRAEIEHAFKLTVVLGTVVALLGMIERATTYNVFLYISNVFPLLEFKPSDVPLDSAMEVRRIAGPSIHAIAFSVVLGMILPLAIHYARAAETRTGRGFYFFSAASIAVTMFLTGSRTSAVAFIVVVAILWLTVPQLRKWTIPGLFVIAVFLHFAFPGAIGMLLERLSPGFLISTETGNQAGRVADYARIMEYFHLRPLLGLGFGSFNPFRYFWLDNEYLKLLAEVGLLGLLAFITFFASGFLRLYRTGRAIGGEVGSLAIAVSASVAVFAVTTFTYDSFGFPQAFNLFFILLGLGLALASVAREDNEFESESVRGFSAGTGALAPAPDRSHRPIDSS